MNLCGGLSMFAVLPIMLCCAAALHSAANAGATDDPPPRQVTVNVTVTIPVQGLTLPSGFVAVMSGVQSNGCTAGRVYAAGIDQEGHVTLSGEFPADTADVFVSLPATPPADSHLSAACVVPTATRIEAAHRADKEFSLPPRSKVSLVPGVDTYSAAFTVLPAIVVRGRSVDPAQQPVRSNVSRTGSINSIWHRNIGGHFEIGGVEKAANGWIFLGRLGDPMKQVIRLTQAQTATDVELGDIVLPVTAQDTTISLTCTGLDIVQSDQGLQRVYVTLIAADASRVYKCAIGEGGSASVESPDGPGQPCVSAGRYFVVPGLFCTSTSVQKVLRLLEVGRQAHLDTAGVPAIDAVANQPVTLSVNVATVQTAIGAIQE